MTIKTLRAESFSPLGPAIKKPIAEKPFIPEQVRPGVFKGADGKLYTDIKANETPAVFHPPKQQMPTPLPTLPVAPSALADGWIEWKGGECPIPARKAGQYEAKDSEGRLWGSCIEASFLDWSHTNAPGDIIAYRVIA